MSSTTQGQSPLISPPPCTPTSRWKALAKLKFAGCKAWSTSIRRDPLCAAVPHPSLGLTRKLGRGREQGACQGRGALEPEDGEGGANRWVKARSSWMFQTHDLDVSPDAWMFQTHRLDVSTGRLDFGHICKTDGVLGLCSELLPKPHVAYWQASPSLHRTVR